MNGDCEEKLAWAGTCAADKRAATSARSRKTASMRWHMAAYCSHNPAADPAGSPAAAATCDVPQVSSAAHSLPFSAWMACAHPPRIDLTYTFLLEAISGLKPP